MSPLNNSEDKSVVTFTNCWNCAAETKCRLQPRELSRSLVTRWASCLAAENDPAHIFIPYVTQIGDFLSRESSKEATRTRKKKACRLHAVFMFTQAAELDRINSQWTERLWNICSIVLTSRDFITWTLRWLQCQIHNSTCTICVIYGDLSQHHFIVHFVFLALYQYRGCHDNLALMKTVVFKDEISTLCE